MKRTYAQVLFFVAVCCLCTGCWDRREIQERSFVLATAIDVVDNKSQIQDPLPLEGSPRYKVSFEVMKLQKKSDQQQGGSGRQTFVVTGSGTSIHEVIRESLAKLDKPLYFEHMQAVVISEAVAKQGIVPVIDLLRRDSEMRERIKVFICQGQAEDIINSKTPHGSPNGNFLKVLIQNKDRSFKLVGALDDLYVVRSMLMQDSVVIIPRLVIKEGYVQESGAAVIKGGKQVFTLDERQLTGIRLLNGTAREGLIPFHCSRHPDDLFVFEVLDLSAHLTPVVQGEQISYLFKLILKGHLSEVQSNNIRKYEQYELAELEQGARQKVLQEVHDSMQLMRENKIDLVNFAAKLKAHEPSTWRRIEERFDEEILPTIQLVPDVKIIIYRTGDIK